MTSPLLQADAIEKEILERCDFNASLQETILLITSCLSSPKQEANDVEETVTLPSASPQGSFSAQNGAKGTNKAKLPKLTLPKFTGDATKWTTFWDSFSSAIHMSEDLNEVDKFQYLKSLLEGAAAETISGLPLTSSNYNHAVLNKRFGSKQVIISKHIEMLMQLPKVSDTGDLKQLRQLLDKTESAVRSLQGIGISIDTYGTFLTPVIMAKIPQELRLILSRGMSDEWDLDTLIKSFAEELQIRERCALGPVTEQSKMREKREFGYGLRFGQSKRPPTSSTLVSYKDRPQQNKEMWCTFCSGPHPSARCAVVTEPEAKKRILRQKGRCFGCLRSGHVSRDCQARCYRCGGKHHVSLCGVQNFAPQFTQARRTNQEQTVSTNLYFTQDVKNNSVLLQTARARVGNPNGGNSCHVRVLFDSCSQRSYISTRLRSKLGLPSFGSETVLIKTFGNNEASLKKCDIVQFALECQDQLKVFVNAYEVELICGPIANQTIEIAQQSYPHLQGLPLADYSRGDEDLEVDIMIGADYYWSIVQNHVVRGESHGPVAVRTRLGYVLSGPTNIAGALQSSSSVNMSHVMKTECQVVEEDLKSVDVSLKEELNKFWDYDTLGVKNREEEFYEDYLAKVKFNGSRYEVSLPFKEEHPTIPDNYLVAQKRLSSSLARLKSKPDILQQYDDVIKDQLNSGVVELVDKSRDQEVIPGTVHYIPHKEVVKEDRTTTKLRVVYDASAKSQNEPSLNDCLLPGPALTPLIFDILLRFRLHRVALIGDLEKAFLNVEVDPEQRNLLRFLWINDISSSNPEVIIFRFTRLVFGLVCSPFILNVTLRNHLSKYENIDPDFVNTVVRALYVDDFASGKDSVKDCFELYGKLKLRFREGGFNMRKWASNSEELIQLIEKEEANLSSSTQPPLETSPSLTKSSVLEEDLIKVMGVPWDRIEDSFKFDLATFATQALDGTLTKRKLLSITARFYDPLGLLSPVMLPLKCMFQEICQLKIGWDEALPEELCLKWKEVAEDMSRVSVISVPRCVLAGIEAEDVKSIQLHGFADASKIAYGANIYIRVTTSNVSYSQLLASKTRVAPLKGETIPRLELMAALTLANLMTAVYKALACTVKVDSVFNWVDSQIVWWWINGESKQFKQFVQNRVTMIQSLWSKEHWGYCPSELNPSDIASRATKSSNLVSNDLWWKGAPFLEKEKDQWPGPPNCPVGEGTLSEETTKKLKKEDADGISQVMTVLVQAPENISEVVQPERFSSLSKLIRVTALVLKFIKRIKRVPEMNSNVSSQEMNAAKILWYKDVQGKLDERERSSSTWEQLGVFKDEDGVLRCKGRIQNSSLPYSAKFPILLPRKQHFTRLVIAQSHENVKHNGVGETLTETRSQFWIIKGRQAVKDVLSKCITCKKIQGRAFSSPPPPPLPSFRVSDDLAFSKVGVDFAGPLYVKNIYQSKGDMFKCYIALFTCASTRAVHLELTPDLTAKSFLRVLKRFFGRRGIPNLFISDNGKTFKDSEVQKFVLNKNIDWNFNVPTASWWGGFFEICVKLVKRCLKKVLGNAKLSYEELESALIETEGVLNSRPLTYVYNELSEAPLTPSHLVIGRRLLEQPSATSVPLSTLARRERYLESLLTHFRNRWRKEYLTGIREYQKLKGEPRRTIQIGDLVHIYGDKTPRQQWRMGKVEKLLRGRDNVVRSAEVATVDKSLRRILIKRPIQKLYPLEVNVFDEGAADMGAVQCDRARNICVVRDEDIPIVVTAS